MFFQGPESSPVTLLYNPLTAKLIRIYLFILVVGVTLSSFIRRLQMCPLHQTQMIHE